MIRVIIGAPTANSSSEVVWSGRKVKHPSGLFSGESADGCCPRLDFYSLRWLPFYWSYRQTNSAQCNERLRLNYFPVYVVVLTFVFTKWQIPPQFCTLQWHSTLFQKILECQYFAKWPEGSHQILFYRIHTLRRQGCQRFCGVFCCKKSLFEQEIIESMKGGGSFL